MSFSLSGSGFFFSICGAYQGFGLYFSPGDCRFYLSWGHMRSPGQIALLMFSTS